MSRQYNDPLGGSPSQIGKQLRTDHYQKQALIDLVKEKFFGQLADVIAMPKNAGKKIVRYHYIPLLDDRNVNDQGIDANGVTISNGNLYGSSRDIGLIPGKMPVLSETGGRVNRVGFVRKELEGSFEKFGFFDEYTKESVDFDTDAQLMTHVNREMLRGANEMTEDLLQIDLLNNAATIRYAGAATSNATLGATDLVTYGDLMRLGIALDNNRTPKKISMITGTRLIDTQTIAGARAMYIGSELLPHLKGLKDLHDRPAFIPLEKYAAGGSPMVGEVGAIDAFRLIVVPQMMKWAGAGKASTGNVHTTGGKVDVFPMLVVGDESFTNIGFQTDGKSVKFTIYHKAPGEATADRNDPYGETGFMSIKWYYGFMALRTERLALIKTAATL